MGKIKLDEQDRRKEKRVFWEERFFENPSQCCQEELHVVGGKGNGTTRK